MSSKGGELFAHTHTYIHTQEGTYTNPVNKITLNCVESLIIHTEYNNDIPTCMNISGIFPTQRFKAAGLCKLEGEKRFKVQKQVTSGNRPVDAHVFNYAVNTYLQGKGIDILNSHKKRDYTLEYCNACR